MFTSLLPTIWLISKTEQNIIQETSTDEENNGYVVIGWNTLATRICSEINWWRGESFTFRSRLLHRYLKTTWTGFPPPRIFASCKIPPSIFASCSPTTFWCRRYSLPSSRPPPPKLMEGWIVQYGLAQCIVVSYSAWWGQGSLCMCVEDFEREFGGGLDTQQWKPR